MNAESIARRDYGEFLLGEVHALCDFWTNHVRDDDVIGPGQAANILRLWAEVRAVYLDDETDPLVKEINNLVRSDLRQIVRQVLCLELGQDFVSQLQNLNNSWEYITDPTVSDEAWRSLYELEMCICTAVRQLRQMDFTLYAIRRLYPEAVTSDWFSLAAESVRAGNAYIDAAPVGFLPAAAEEQEQFNATYAGLLDHDDDLFEVAGNRYALVELLDSAGRVSVRSPEADVEIQRIRWATCLATCEVSPRSN
jgi:hypothetical protein